MGSMGMTVKVTGAMACLAISTAGRTKRGIGGGRIGGAGRGVMTSRTGVMDLIARDAVNRSGQGCTLDQGVGMTSDTIDMVVNPGLMVCLDMAAEVSAVAGVTVTTVNRPNRSLAGGCIGGDHAGHRYLMAGRTSIMNLIGCRVNWNTGSRTNNRRRRMAGGVTVGH